MDRPIIFSAPMVRALLDGRKTQMRRFVQVPNDATVHAVNRVPGARYPEWEWRRFHKHGRIRVPYAPGDRLWVREAWATVNTSFGPGWGYRADSNFIQPEYDGENFGAGPSFNYDKYPGEYSMWFEDLLARSPGHRWERAIHMPRWASRLTLTVTDVRVQRLQDITEEDARAEGVRREMKICEDDGTTFIDAFGDLWDDIHGPGAWDANPWVSAISFTVERRNIDA